MVVLRQVLQICLMASHFGPARATVGLPVYAFQKWSKALNDSFCSNSSVPIRINIVSKAGGVGVIKCALRPHPLATNIPIREYQFPVGIFEIGSQFLLPERTSILGAASPNDMSNATHSPNWNSQTLFLATRGVADYLKAYCHAANMVTTRVGFVLSSYVSMTNLSYQVKCNSPITITSTVIIHFRVMHLSHSTLLLQGIDVIRPNDNGGLCGGGAFETKGCAENDCSSSKVNNAGSDGIGSVYVTIDNVRINDFHFGKFVAPHTFQSFSQP